MEFKRGPEPVRPSSLVPAEVFDGTSQTSGTQLTGRFERNRHQRTATPFDSVRELSGGKGFRTAERARFPIETRAVSTHPRSISIQWRISHDPLASQTQSRFLDVSSQEAVAVSRRGQNGNRDTTPGAAVDGDSLKRLLWVSASGPRQRPEEGLQSTRPP